MVNGDRGVDFGGEALRLTLSVEQAARYFGGPGYVPGADARRRIEDGIRQALDLIAPAVALAQHDVVEVTGDGVLHLAKGISLDLPASSCERPLRLAVQERSGPCHGPDCGAPLLSAGIARKRRLPAVDSSGAAAEREVKMIAVGIGTLGGGLEERCRALARRGEIYRATLLDAVGSAMLDILGSRLWSAAEEQAKGCGFFLGGRFSPGLDGYPLERQQLLLQLLGDGTAGVRLNRAWVMEPLKSISFFGLLTTVENGDPRVDKCQACRLDHCQYRMTH